MLSDDGLGAKRPRNRIAAIFLVALMVGGLGAAVGGSHLSPSRAFGGGVAPSTGAGQLRAASASLLHGAGPAAGHSAAITASPGGYAWYNATGRLSLAPTGRLTTLTWDASDGYVLLYGYATLGGNAVDTWSYLNGTWMNLTASVTGVPATPAQSPYATLGYDPSTAKAVLFLPIVNATWTYHAKTWTNVTATAGAHPPSVQSGNLVADTTDGELLFFGGVIRYSGAFSSATWVFKNGAWSNVSALSPFNFGRIIYPVLSDDPSDHGVLALGISEWGLGAVYYSSTFLFSGGVWTNLTPSAGQEPTIGLLPAIGFVPAISAVVVYDGILAARNGSAVSTQTTWEFANRAWTNVTSVTGVQPTQGFYSTGAVDPIDGSFVLFGGERLGAPIVYPSTWLFSAAPRVSASVNHESIDLGQSVTFVGSAAGTTPVAISWGFGDSTTASGTSASHTYTHPGIYTVTATATDFVGATGTASVSVAVNPALAVTANGTPTRGVAGGWETLQSAVSGGTPPYSFAWTLGDSSTSSAGSLGHVYASAGSYAVHLTVTDGTGATAVTNFTVVVSSAPSTGSTGSASLTSGTGLYLLIGLVIGWVLAIAFLAMWAGGRRGRGGPPQPYTMGSSGGMGSSPPGSMPPGAGGSGLPPPPT